jgi:ABC-type glycerol-3-phosphate transport system permease component
MKPAVKARLVTGLIYTSLLAGVVAALLPLIAIAMASFKTADEYATTPPFAPPGNWLNLDNYVTAFTDGKMLLGFANTAFILTVSLVGTVLIGSMAAYAIDRFTFPMRGLVIGLFLIAALVPGVTTQVTTFKVVNDLGLYNTRWSAIALFLGTDIISIYIFRQFLRSIPTEVDEAAALDGADPFTIYRRVILPQLKPAIATVVIIRGVAIYNEFYVPFLYMPSRDLGVISTSLFRFKGPFGSEWEIISAGVILIIVPTLIAFLALQRFIYNGFATGATR